jgi:O-Antigen ligase
MLGGLISIFFTAVSAMVAFVSAPRGGAFCLFRIVAVWVSVAVFAFLIGNKWLVFALISLTLFIVAPARPAERVYLYIGAMVAIPAGLSLNLPFPGLNYLISLDYAKITTLILLGPIFVKNLMSRPPQHLKTVGRLLVIFVLLTGVMSIRDLPFTSMLRALFDQFLLVIIPYFAISRALTTQAEIDNAIRALFLSAIILAGIGIFSTLWRWNYYVHLSEQIFAKSFTEYRNGFLRISATVGGTLLGFVMGFAIAATFVFQAAKEYPKVHAIALSGVFAFVLFTTGARGGWLAAILIAGSYFLLSKLNKSGRQLLLISLVAGVVTIMVLVFQDSALLSDEYGTIDYRADLLRTSMKQIAERPLFGSADFLESPRFAHLRQGEGIIDLVNVYIQLSLHYGLVGFSLFFGANLLVLHAGVATLGRLPFGRDIGAKAAAARRTVVLLIAIHIGYLAMIATISWVSYIWQYGFVILGLMAAQVRVGVLPGAAPEHHIEIPPAQDPSPPPSASNSRAHLPYGARFVRRS